jgi:hypothetical protein
MVSVIFDETAEFSQTALQIYLEYKADKKWGERLAALAFADSEKFTPLQAADMLVYGTGYHLSEKFYPGQRRVDFPVLPLMSNLIQGVAAEGGFFDREQLAPIIKREIDRALLREISRKGQLP